MFTFPIQYILLVAIAFSQIFGGISCCCLGSAMAGVVSADSLATATQTAAKQASAHAPEMEALLSPAEAPACPNCATKKSDSSEENDSRRKGTLPCASSEDGEPCECEKQSLDLYASSESASVRLDLGVWSVVVFAPVTLHEAISLTLQSYEAPLRLIGRSWQSIAHVWMN